MVYVDWTAQNICKYWMLQRCGFGYDCPYRHPKDWRQLWDREIARQNEKERQGIGRSRQPAGEESAIRAGAWRQYSSEARPKDDPATGKRFHPFENRERRPDQYMENLSAIAPARRRGDVEISSQPVPLPPPPSRRRRQSGISDLVSPVAQPRSPPPSLAQNQAGDKSWNVDKFLESVMTPKRMSNGDVKHPPRSEIRVSAPYLSQAAIEKKLYAPSVANSTNDGAASTQERSISEAREDNVRLQGCTWMDNVRRALDLPIRTYTTACVYYHKLRLANPGLLHPGDSSMQASIADACAASLLTACKVEDTLKKSRDILATAYNLKTAATHEHIGSDDPIFEGPAKHVMVLERMVLEAGGFDFRSKHPHTLLIKIAKTITVPDEHQTELMNMSKVAWTILTDLHRTFAPLKQTSSTMALASLELAALLLANSSKDDISIVRSELLQFPIEELSTTREEIMETLLDLLDLYTHHTASTALGSLYSLDDFLRIRLAMNKECTESNISRYTAAPETPTLRLSNGTTSRVDNGHPTPVSPPVFDSQAQLQAQNTNRQQQDEPIHTHRFVLDPQRAAAEKAEVQKYFVEEWEEYEEEIDVPIPRERSRERREKRPDSEPMRSREEREREREKLRDREREIERERARLREREREREQRRRYDDRDRRYDDKRDYRYDEDRRRRDERR